MTGKSAVLRAEEPAKTCPHIFSHPGINSQAGLCLQCYIYMEQPYGIEIFLLTAALLSSKQRREGLLQNNTCCISVSLQTASQVQRRQLLRCNPPACSQLMGVSVGHVLPSPDRNAPGMDLNSHPWEGMVEVSAHHSPLSTMRLM